MALYKQHSGIKRVPLGQLRVERPHRPYLTEDEFKALLDGEVIVEEKVDGHPEVLEESSYVFYCEDLRYKHAIEYTRVPAPRLQAPAFFVCYDLWMTEEDRWAVREEKENLCEMMGLPVSPLVYRGILKEEEIPIVSAFKSNFGDGQADGIVIKNLKNGIFGKFINMEFQKGLEDAENWRRGEWKMNRLVII